MNASPLTKPPVMPWGKFKGKPVREVKTSYLFWVCSGSCAVAPDWLKAACREELARRFADHDTTRLGDPR